MGCVLYLGFRICTLCRSRLAMDDGQELECIYLQYLHDHLISVFNFDI